MRSADPRSGPFWSLAVAAACALPFVFLVALSLAGRWPFPDLLPAEWTLGRWQGLLAGEGGLLASLGRSLALSVGVAAVSTALGFFTSRAVAEHPRRRLLLFFAYLPFVFSPAILATCLLYLFLRLDLAGSWPGVALAQTMLGYSFAVVFFQGFWNTEKRALGELVATLGGSTWQLYRRVYLPLGSEMLRLAFLQTFLLSFFQYGATVLIGAGRVETLPLAVYHFVGEANPGYAAVAGCLLILPPFLLLWLDRRRIFRPPLA